MSFSDTVDIAALRAQLATYLEIYERQFPMNPATMQAMPAGVFPVRPLELKKLHLVAMVQDELTREVLQVATIPVNVAEALGAKSPPDDLPESKTSVVDKPTSVTAPVPDNPPAGPKLIAPGTQQ